MTASARVLVVVAVAAAAGGIGLAAYLFVGGRESVTVAELRVGDCIERPPDGVLQVRLQRIGCDRPHRGEVYAILEMPDAPGYPG